MSYILDALRKSDQERQQHVSPALSSVHAPYRANASSRPGWLRSGGLVLLLIAGTAGGAWLFVGSVRPGAVSPDGEDAASVLGDPPLAATPAPIDATNVSSTADSDARTLGAGSPLSLPAEVEELLEIWQLTEAEQRYLEALEVSLHVYSTEPYQRTVIINGLRAREGQPLGTDLRLEEITPDGLILDFRGRRVHLETIGRG